MRFFGIVFVVFLTTPAFVFGATSDFPRTLKMGMRGEDVRALQVVLNADVETRIATSGAGSPGSETDYFGPATKRALVKFQEKYRAEVLAPAGLTTGTGVFGEKTRIKVKALLINTSVAKNIPTIVVPSTVAASLPSKTEVRIIPEGDVFIAFPSQYSGKPGTEITISGEGFTATNNTIYFGSTKATENVSSSSGFTLVLKVPNLPKGIYPLSVKNIQGQTKGDSFFVVTDGITPEPKVESVTPDTAQRGTVITVNGSGFTKTGNMVRTTIGIFENISSIDGKSISFTIPENILTATTTPSFAVSVKPLTNFVPPAAKKVFLPMWVVVVNENGVSNGKSFKLEL